MAISKKSFVNLDLQGNALVNPTIGLNSNMTKAGSFQYNAAELRLEYFNGTSVKQVANLSDISAVTGGLIFQAGYDPTTNTPDITVVDDSVKKGFFWVATAAGTFFGEAVQVGDSIIAKQDNPGTTAANWLILQGNVVIATDTVDGISRLATQAEVDAGTEGGAVVLTPATFAASQQLADINTDITNLENDKLSKTGGTISGDIDMDGNNINGVTELKTAAIYANDIYSRDNVNVNLLSGLDAQNAQTIVNLPAPINGGDAANKQYVDDQDALKLSLSGGTMSGNIDMNGNNVIGVGAVSTSQLDSGSTLVPVNLASDLNFNSNSNNPSLRKKIVNLTSPTDDYDGANKIYVDDTAATAQANAETSANTYTDEKIAAQSLTIPITGWVYDGDGGYYVNIQMPYDNAIAQVYETSTNDLIDTAITIGGTTILIFSNIQISDNAWTVRVVKTTN